MPEEVNVGGVISKARGDRERPAIPAGHVVSLAFRVRPEARDELLAYVSKAFPFCERPGGIRLGLYESVDEPGLFQELAVYATEKDYLADQARVENADYREVLDDLRKLVDGGTEVRRLKAVPVVRKEFVVGPASLAAIESVWKRRWGVPYYSPGRQYMPDDVEGLVATAADDEVLGLITWTVEGAEAQLVTLDALELGHGVGARLLAAAEQTILKGGARPIRVVIANDNLTGLNFFQRHGFRLVRVHLDGVEEVRRLKAGMPEFGRGQVPLRDLWELVKEPPPAEASW